MVAQSYNADPKDVSCFAETEFKAEESVKTSTSAKLEGGTIVSAH